MAGIDLDPQAREVAANVVRGVVSPEDAATAAGVSLETVNQWVAGYVTDAKAGFEARAKSLLSQTKAGMLPQTAKTRAKPIQPVPSPAPPTPGTVPTPVVPSSRGPLPPPTPFLSQMATPSSSGVLPPLAPPALVRPNAQSSDGWLRAQPVPPTVTYPLPKPMAVGTSYAGAIEGDILLDVSRSLATMQQNGILTIRSARDSGTIHFDAGEIVDAQYRGLGGQDALWRLFDVSKGTYEVEGYSPPKHRMVDAASSALLAEAARRRSIARSLKKHLGSAHQVFALVPLTREQLATVGKVDPEIIALFDGKRSLQQVVADSPHDEFTTLSQVQRLHDRGYLIPMSLRPVEILNGPELSVSLSPERESSEIPSVLPFKNRRAGRWVGGGAVALGGMLAGAVFVAEGSLSPDAAGTAFSRIREVFATGADERVDARIPAAAIGGLSGVLDTSICTAAAPVAASNEQATPSCPEGMVYIAPGRLTMGTNERTPALEPAYPAHDVELEQGFCIDRVEVTTAAYSRCASDKSCTEVSARAMWPQTEATPKAWESSLILHGKQCNAGAQERWNHPINCVTWTQANAYCEALGRRLPSEVEWEFAARGAAGRSFPWGNNAPKADLLNACGRECTAWHESVGLRPQILGALYELNDGFAGTSPAGAFGLGATPEGVLDLAGNVSEWTANAPYEYSAVADSDDAVRPTTGDAHMVRGGAYNSSAVEFVEAAFRFAMPNDTLSPGIGFRCAATP